MKSQRGDGNMRRLLVLCILIIFVSFCFEATAHERPLIAESTREKDEGKDVVDTLFQEKQKRSKVEEKDESRENEEPVNRVFHLKGIVVTATRVKTLAFDVPYSIHILLSDELAKCQLSPTVPEVLREVPGVMVQKTSRGQGSPFIRGFTGYRTLFLIDGIRLNNSVFRDGPNQYWNTVDPLIISRIEMIKGPSSVLYGSDAVGGDVNAVTRESKKHATGFSRGATFYYRYASAENASVSRVEISGNLQGRIGALLGFSLKRFGDVRGGRTVGLQPKSGYDEWDWDLKCEYMINNDSRLVFGHQRTDLDDVWRTHRTIYGISWRKTTKGTDKKLVLDQYRQLTYLQYEANKPLSFIDRLKASLSYHVQKEEQFRVKSNDASEKQGFDVKTPGVWIQIESSSPIGHLVYGAEFYRDNVNSFLNRYHADGTLEKVEIQGPVGDDASYDNLGIFAQSEVPVSRRLKLTIGARFTEVSACAAKVRDPLTGNRISISSHWNAFVGSARLLFKADRKGRCNLFAGVSQGFRAPNLSDLSRFDIARSNEIEVAAPRLDPERFVSYEIGLRTDYNHWSTQLAYFFTDIENMIIRVPTGNIVEGNNEVTKKNAGDGFIQGIELEAIYRLRPQLSMGGSFSWMDGEVEIYPTSSPEKKREPVDRLMPQTLNLSMRWAKPTPAYWIEGLCTIVARQDKLSSRDKADNERMPPDGTPGYTVLTFRSGWELTEHLIVSVAVENVANEDYRIHGSGYNEPGRNFVLGLDFTF